MSYTSLGTKYTDIPDLHIAWQDLLFFRSYQGAGLTRIIYYASAITALVVLLMQIIVTTQQLGAGGFFLGLLFGLLFAFFMVVGTRLALEVALSVFAIRDHLATIAAQGGTNPLSHPISTTPASAQNISFQPASYDTAVQPQSPSVFEPHQYQGGYQSQSGGYQSQE